MTTSAELATRYGKPSPARRKVAIAVTTLLGMGAAWFVTDMMLFHANPAVSSSLVGFEIVDDYAVDVELRVQLDDIDEAECLVRALSKDKSVVGELGFLGIDGQQEVTVRTERRATGVELVGCKADGQTRWR